MSDEARMSAGERLAIQRMRDAAMKLAKTNGEPSCKEHRESTVMVLEGQIVMLEEIKAHNDRAGRIDSRLMRIEEMTATTKAHLSTLADAVHQAKQLLAGITEGELTNTGLIKGLALQILPHLPIAKAINRSGGTVMWVCLTLITVSICGTLLYLVHKVG